MNIIMKYNQFYGIVLFLYFASLCVNCGPHTHVHKQSGGDITKEREEDGLINRRDKDHYKDGEHHSEFDHEAVLGSRDAAEEFDHLPPEDAKKKLKILAEKMDKNHDGFVDRPELTNWVLKSFRMLTEEEADEQMEEEDGNEDGKVTWQEHIAETFNIYEEDIDLERDPDELAEEQKMMKGDKELFMAADLNGDGALDKKEYPAFSHSEEFEHMHQVLYEQTMRKRDKNNDGFLNLEEYLADNHGKLPAPNSEYYVIEKDRFDHDYDRDKDRKLNREETLLWLIPNNHEMAENEADHLIHSSDVDKDGKLSIQEIVDHHDVFVGSEATDFGEHLHNTQKFNDEL